MKDFIFELQRFASGVSVINSLNNTIITGTAYADSIENRGDSVTIAALGGDDTIIGGYVTYDGWKGGMNSSISGGEDNDWIQNA